MSRHGDSERCLGQGRSDEAVCGLYTSGMNLAGMSRERRLLASRMGGSDGFVFDAG
jgi:hypothetical protein